MPVASMSMRPLIGIVQALATPGIFTAESICDTSLSYVIPARHSLNGLSVIVVSNMSRPAGSVAVFARPALPHTCSTSGNRLRISSCTRRISRARATLTPGRVVGMKRIVPSSSGGMNSEPILLHGIQVRTTSAAATPITGHRLRSTREITGRYALMSARLTGFADSR